MLPMAALKKKAKEHSLHKLISVMRGMEMKDGPGQEDPKEEALESPAMESHEPLEPDMEGMAQEHDRGESELPPELDPDQEFQADKQSFMKRSVHSPVKGKARYMIALTAGSSKSPGFPTKGKRY